jgi:radical SAM protein with 4Fe4S-binding SPASM domain
MQPTDTRTVELDQPLDLPPSLSWHQIEDAYLFIAPGQPNWVTTDRLGATLLLAMSWGETPRAALRFAGQAMGKPPETLVEALKALLTELARRRFHAGTPVETLDLSTARRMLHLYVTNRCNLHCPHCYMDAGMPSGEELTTSEWCRLIDRFTECVGESAVSFSGGEPLVRRDFFDIAAHAKSRGHRTMLLSNGTLIDNEACAARLADMFDWIQVSLDGATPAVHDALRGTGSFRRTMQAIHLLAGEDVRLRIAVTVMSQNASDLSAHLVDRLGEIDKRVDVAVNGAWPEGRARSNRVCATVVTDDAVANILSQLREAGWTGAPPRRRRRPRHTCGYGGGIIVSAGGDVHPCPVLHRSLGNVRTAALPDLLTQLNRIYTEFGVDHIEACASCDLRYICGGGCRVRNLRERGDTHTCPPESRKAIYRQLLDLEVPDHKAPALVGGRANAGTLRIDATRS